MNGGLRGGSGDIPDNIPPAPAGHHHQQQQYSQQQQFSHQQQAVGAAQSCQQTVLCQPTSSSPGAGQGNAVSLATSSSSPNVAGTPTNKYVNPIVAATHPSKSPSPQSQPPQYYSSLPLRHARHAQRVDRTLPRSKDPLTHTQYFLHERYSRRLSPPVNSHYYTHHNNYLNFYQHQCNTYHQHNYNRHHPMMVHHYGPTTGSTPPFGGGHYHPKRYHHSMGGLGLRTDQHEMVIMPGPAACSDSDDNQE